MTIQTVGLDGTSGLSSSGTTSQKADNRGELGRDDFLQLLITQLKNQDPLNPLESVEFTGQLAQFSSLDELFQMSDHLQSIENSLLLQQGDQLVSYIGKSVKSAGNTMAVQGGQVKPGTYNLASDADVQVSIYSPSGALVRTLGMGWQKKGDYQVSWDGKDMTGNPVADGNYVFYVQGTDVSGQPVSCQTYIAGEVSGIRHENGRSYLLVGGKQILPENILEVSQS
jgi:flagellar basal-body rod modification protein FlgD